MKGMRSHQSEARNMTPNTRRPRTLILNNETESCDGMKKKIGLKGKKIGGTIILAQLK